MVKKQELTVVYVIMAGQGGIIVPWEVHVDRKKAERRVKHLTKKHSVDTGYVQIDSFNIQPVFLWE